MRGSRVRKASKNEVLEIRCQSDVKVAFKVLAAQLDENYEETLKQLMEMEKEHPLQKSMKGLVERI